ncbi:2-nitropropane dioxygenase [Hoeflea sp. BAL378]|uniref:NAD(P)H-dependent flavin oxidoreductase n=1 Tax=Hoeflea sp. BAL378 TaxID=1547437 RepID=UPI00051300EA|nr:nitronate monooxygenase family protein [Hoeflea sp. BAL378]KGF70715.1 2-nitropropane dioxygenase [Hoeflea sp. BAL378]
MPMPDSLAGRLRLPVIAAPMFIVSQPALVKAQCKAGIVGSFPALNARPQAVLDEWLSEIEEDLAAHDRANPARPAAPFAVNLIVHKSNDRVEADLATCVAHKVPIVITSMGVRKEVMEAVHGYGGLVFHDVVNLKFARKAAEFGADGLIAVAAGAGGHAGALSPFALIQELRSWFHGALALSGAIATGRSVLAAQAMGADLAYVGSAFIATEEANAAPEYKAMITAGAADDIIYTPVFSGVPANYLKPSIVAAGLDPDNLPDPAKTNYGGSATGPKPWKDVWGAGQGIGAVSAVVPAAELVARMAREYLSARDEMLQAAAGWEAAQ